MFGGKGANLSCIGLFLEEISSVCLATANIIGVHYLGFTILTASWNLRLINRVSREVAAGERNDDPCLISLAITEPDAGTDAQNIELMDLGNLSCRAQRTKEGYRVNGSKVFISMGHVSTWHIVNAYTDLEKPSESTVMLAVKKGAAGFSLGKKEDKMGQRGCPASELIFNDCLVPLENACIDSDQAQSFSRGRKGTNEQVLAYIWGASRMGVASFGAGAARGAYQEALAFAGQKRIEGKPLLQHEWCQGRLAEMYKNAALSRAIFMEAAFANALYGFWKLLNKGPLYYFLRILPEGLANRLFPRLCEKPFATKFIRKLAFDGQSDEEMARVDALASVAKVAATDAAVANCRLAMEMMGEAGFRQGRRMEKMVRDARLLQIYEGTNQVNRVNVFKRTGARTQDGAEVFTRKVV
jgi:alkylation response protein AidB-like acyl-CoA dehydrogenase